MRTNFIATLTIGALLSPGVAFAQQKVQSPASQQPPGQVTIPGSNYDIVFGTAELAPGQQTRRHSHPGAVIVYVANGEFWTLIDGQPGQRYKVGDASQVPERAFPTEGQASGAAAVMAVYIVEKGRPASAAAPSQ